jgi:hypothetical protein
VGASGLGNIAINLFGHGTSQFGNNVLAQGNFNVAANLGGQDNDVEAGQQIGRLNTAFNVFGSNNTVHAAPGPLALAGSILQNNSTVTKAGPGFNINGAEIGGASATGQSKAAPAQETASDHHTAKSARSNRALSRIA